MMQLKYAFTLGFSALLFATSPAQAKGFYCSYDRKCQASDVSQQSCVPEEFEASVFDIETDSPKIFALETTFAVEDSVRNANGTQVTFGGTTDFGGFEAITVQLTDLASVYRQTFTTDDGQKIDVVYIGQCESD